MASSFAIATPEHDRQPEHGVEERTMATEKVRVWSGEDRIAQHFAPPPGDETARTWEGVTECGLEGPLVWIHLEHVDSAKACANCVGLVGRRPPLEGDHPGPV
jgi:hypothetical protein